MNWNFTITGTVVSAVKLDNDTVDISVVSMDSYTDAEGVDQYRQTLFFVNSGNVDISRIFSKLKRGARVGIEGYYDGEEYTRNQNNPQWISINGPHVHHGDDGEPYTAIEGVATDIKILAPPIEFENYKKQEDLLTSVIVGVLGRDAELRYTTSGRLLCQTSIRTKRFRYVDVGGGERQREEITVWMRITLWGDSAERAAKWWKKDKAIIVKVTPRVEANGAPRIWTNNTGDKVASLEGNVRWWTFVPGDLATTSTISDDGYVEPEKSGYDEDIPF